MSPLSGRAEKFAAVLGLLLLTGLALPAAAQAPAPNPLCDPLPRPTVELTFTNNAPIQHNERSVTELAGMRIDTTFSHSIKETFMLTGAAVSSFQPTYGVKFSARTTADGRICTAPYDVAITVVYNPIIYIAREAPVGSCDYTVILQHEVRHVNTDILTFNEYLPQLKAAVEDTIATMPVVGPVNPGDIHRVDETLFQQIQTVFVKKITELNQVRFNRQQMIDTRQEYMRTSHACPADSPLNTALAGRLPVFVMPADAPAAAPAR